MRSDYMIPNTTNKGTAMKLWNWITMVLAGVIFASGVALAQEAPKDSKPPEKDPQLVAAAEQEKFIQEQVNALKMLMKTYAESIKKDQPDIAAAFIQAADEVDSKKLMDDLGKAIVAMEKNQAGDAHETQKDVVAKMKEILATLRNGKAPDKKALDEMKETSKAISDLIEEQKKAMDKQHAVNNADALKKLMADAIAELGEIKKAQENLLKETLNMGEGDAGLRKLGELKAQIDKMIEVQKDLRDKTDKDEIGKLALDGERQRDLSKVADQVGKDLADAAKDPKIIESLNKGGADPKAADVAAASTKNASGNMKTAADGLTKSTSKDADLAAKDQDQALNNLEKAQKALADALAKAGGKTPADGIAKKQDDLKNRLDKVNQTVKDISAQTGQRTDTSKCEGAASDMAKAGENLKGQNPKAAAENQKDAIKKLSDDEVRKLAELSRKLDEMVKASDKDAQKQGQIAKKSEEIANKMGQKSEKIPNGMPGKDKMSQAQKSASSAADKIKKGAGKGGQGGECDQDEAKKKMEEAKKDLDDAIAQLEEQKQDQAIAKIIDMLGKMLETQKAATSDTRTLDGKKADGKAWTRPEELAVAKLSTQEGTLGDESTKIIKMLTEEGTTAVFPRVLKQVEVDLRDLQNMLGEKQTGELTQAIQGSVEKNIQGMIDALKKEQGYRKKAGNCCGGGCKPPLVPPEAELKMLRNLQLDINGRTVSVATLKEKNVLPAETIKKQHENLSIKQKEVETMTIDLKNKMKEQQK